MANALADMARSTGPIGIAIRALFDNIGRLATYAATFAALMAGRWVAGLAAAAAVGARARHRASSCCAAR